MKLKLRNPFKGFTKLEWVLWIISLTAVSLSYILFSNTDYVTLIVTLLGVSSLIFVARGDVYGQLITFVFCLLYAYVSYKAGYYGETIIYLFMHFPICVMSIISWLKNPYNNDGSQVKVSSPSSKKLVLLFISSAVITIVFYFLLKYLNTSSLIVSTLSVLTSYLALGLLVFRSPYYAVVFIVNDIVLIVLWTVSAIKNISAIPMVVCFVMFLINDIYGFVNWNKMKKQQKSGKKALTDI